MGLIVTTWRDEHGIPMDNEGRYDATTIDWRVLEDIPTLHQGYTADLKIESGQRVWLERTTTADGEHCDHHITVETLDGQGRWVTTSEN